MRLELANAVRKHRSRLGITQEELAWRAGLHRTYLAGIEAGARNPTLQSIARLARALNLSLSALFAEIDEELAALQGTPADPSKASPLADLLLVEDNVRDIEMTRRALERFALANPLHVVRDGAEALDYLFCREAYAGRDITRPPRLILLDLYLPKVDGLEVLRQIKAHPRTATIPVAVLTSSQDGIDVAESLRLGADAYIVKPVDFHGLGRAVPQLRLCWVLVGATQETARLP